MDLPHVSSVDVDPDRLQQHLQIFAERIKLSGTAPELENVHYLKECLDACGYRTAVISHPAYISLPGAARIEIGSASPSCITHSFSRPSGPAGVSGTLVYGKFGRAEDFAGLDVRGRIVVLEGIANPGASLRASQAGAVGQIHISPHEHIHEMCISSVWGSPTPTTLQLLPTTVVISIAKADGDALKHRIEHETTVEASLFAEVATGWCTTPILEAELMPDAEQDAPFILFSGHQDTWYYGVMDNGGANATMLEVARLCAMERAQWRRGLRLCFWSGHSHGRYSGSAWYADNRWHELERRCAAHVNVDSTGAKGNTVLADAPAASELLALARDAVSGEGDQELTGLRMGRAGDQSFWGIGVPSMFMGMGEQPAAEAVNLTGAVFGGGERKGAGFGWWWHTPEDTLDKMDSDLHVRDTRIYLHTLRRLLTDPVLPLDYAAHAAFLQRHVEQLAPPLAGVLDLRPIIDGAQLVADAAVRLHDAAAEPRRIDAALMATSRALVPIDYTAGDRFEHDPALPLPPIPVLEPIRRLAAASPGSDEQAFLLVAATRARNRITHAFAQAAAALVAGAG